MTSEDRSNATYALAEKSLIEAWPQRGFFSQKEEQQTNKKNPIKT